jgi:uncharacterized membrane protein
VSDESFATRDSERDDQDSVWTFRGYRISPREFNTAMVHLYRGEVTRSNLWRTRLDTTTNWAVVTTAAALTFSFSSASNTHAMLLLTMALVTLFLYIEARRYRYYELWAYRVRMLETDFYSAMLVPPFAPSKQWAEELAASLLQPEFPISMAEALGRRLRRNYIWLFVLLTASWLAKIAVHPTHLSTATEFLIRAGIGPVPGEWVAGAVAVLDVAILLLALATVGMQQSAGEVLPNGTMLGSFKRWRTALRDVPGEILPLDRLRVSWLGPRRERLTIIITSQGKEVADRIMNEVRHGVTAISGTGMYTGEPRDVLLCAIHPTEVHELKAVVHSVDPGAFVIINPAQQVVGGGFEPFTRKSRRRKKRRDRSK